MVFLEEMVRIVGDFELLKHVLCHDKSGRALVSMDLIIWKATTIKIFTQNLGFKSRWDRGASWLSLPFLCENGSGMGLGL